MSDPKVQVPALVLRLDKGSELTHEEGDQNLKKLRDFCNMLSSWIEGSLNEDGTLKAGAISDATLIANAIITRDKLAFSQILFAEDSGVDDNTYELVIGTDASGTHLPEVPSKTSEESFVVWMLAKRTNTGPSFLKLSATDTTFHDSIPIKKQGDLELTPGDIQKEELICLVFEPVSQTVRIVSGAGSSSSSSGSMTQNFSGLTKFESSQATDLDGTGFPVDHTFTHGLNREPDRVVAYLRCTSNDNGYIVGQEVPITEFVQTGSEPAFTIAVSSTNIIVTEAAAASVVDPSTGSLGAITAASWSLYVKAWVYTSVSTPTFPGLTFSSRALGTPMGYKNKLYSFEFPETTGKGLFYETDITNRNVQRIALATFDAAAGDGHIYGSSTVWRKANGEDHILQVDQAGWGSILLASPWTTRTFNAGGNFDYRVCWLDEVTGLGAATSPDLYAVRQIRNCSTSNIPCVLLAYNGTIYPGPVAHGTNLDLHDAAITNVSAFDANVGGVVPYLEAFQYNPANRRIYVVEGNTNFCHIFNIDGHTSNDFSTWWTDPNRYNKLTYEKALSISSAGYGAYTQHRKRYFVEFDLETGDEIAIWSICWHNNETTIVRTPWVE